MEKEGKASSCSCEPVEEILPELSWCSALNAVDCVMLGILNSDAQFLWVNNALAEYFNRPSDECVGEYCCSFFDDDKLRAWFKSARVDESVPLVDFGMKKIKCSVKILGHGENGYLFAAIDVTEGFLQEDALSAFREREECSRVRHDCLMKKISHEFRTILMSLSGLVEFLKDTDVSSEQRAFVEGLEACVTNSMDMLEGLLLEDQENNRIECYPDLGDGAVQLIAEPQLSEKSKPVDGSYRVLLAEDNPVNAKVVSKMLSDAGYIVDVVPTGAVAVARIESRMHKYDLIVMDCEMPEMDGYDATIRIRQMGWRKPVVALTADASSGARARCVEAGMDAYVTKPVRASQLCKIIANELVGC